MLFWDRFVTLVCRSGWSDRHPRDPGGHGPHRRHRWMGGNGGGREVRGTLLLELHMFLEASVQLSPRCDFGSRSREIGSS